MPALQPIFATDRTSAKLLDMKLLQFLELVEAGALPKPVKIGGQLVRWSVKELEAIKTGEIMEAEFEW